MEPNAGCSGSATEPPSCRSGLGQHLDTVGLPRAWSRRSGPAEDGLCGASQDRHLPWGPAESVVSATGRSRKEIPGFASPPHDGFALSDGYLAAFDRLPGGLEHSLSRLDTMVGTSGAVVLPQLADATRSRRTLARSTGILGVRVRETSQSSHCLEIGRAS